jgi:ParB family transcriptional regulator, chromosome partitioning protein
MSTLTVEDIDPRTLLVDLNIREAKPSKGLIASIKDLGVLQPIIAVRTADGDIRVRMGNRRTLGAIEADRPTVPVIVVADEATDDQASIDRILAQYAENSHREGLTAAEEVGAVAQLLDLGMSAAAVTRRTQLPKARVAAVKTVQGSEAAQDAMGKYDLDIEQAAAVAEFADDPAAVKQLIEAAQYNAGSFKHRVQWLRDEREGRKKAAAKHAELTAAGVPLLPLGDQPPNGHRLYMLKDSDGKELTEESHQGCPGHTAFLNGTRDAVSYFCADPELHGHKPRYGDSVDGSGGVENLSAEEATEKRRETIANNKLWRSATTVRRDFLKELLARKKAPEGALWVIIQALAEGGTSLRRQMEKGHKAARPLLGLPESDVPYGQASVADLMDMLDKSTDDRVLLIALGLVLAAYEDATYADMWKNPTSHTDAADYFKLLVSWGYGLSEIEQLIVTACEERAAQLAEAAAAEATDGDDEAAA